MYITDAQSRETKTANAGNSGIEVDLIAQFEQLLDKIDIDEIGIREKIKYEVERIKKFQQ
jgi:hypothetical protein